VSLAVSRSVLTWRILGEDLVGTCHAPAPTAPGAPAPAVPVAVLLLNAGSAPRSGNSDFGVALAERLARRGFPVYRFDFAGLGDSSGPTPRDLDSYWNEVVHGRNDEATQALIARLGLECGFTRVVVGGLCAAALPSVRALEHAACAPVGLLLLEPNFRLTAGNATGAPRAAEQGRQARLLQRAWGGLAPLRRRVRPAFLGRLRARFGPRWPADANRALVTTWLASLARGVPSLLVVAADGGTEHYLTRLLRARPAADAPALTRVRVPETNHLFSAGSGRAAVLAACERWMTTRFGATPTVAGLAPVAGGEER